MVMTIRREKIITECRKIREALNSVEAELNRVKGFRSSNAHLAMMYERLMEIHLRLEALQQYAIEEKTSPAVHDEEEIWL
jgi:hypothetical protein